MCRVDISPQQPAYMRILHAWGKSIGVERSSTTRRHRTSISKAMCRLNSQVIWRSVIRNVANFFRVHVNRSHYASHHSSLPRHLQSPIGEHPDDNGIPLFYKFRIHLLEPRMQQRLSSRNSESSHSNLVSGKYLCSLPHMNKRHVTRFVLHGQNAQQLHAIQTSPIAQQSKINMIVCEENTVWPDERSQEAVGLHGIPPI